MRKFRAENLEGKVVEFEAKSLRAAQLKVNKLFCMLDKVNLFNAETGLFVTARVSMVPHKTKNSVGFVWR